MRKPNLQTGAMFLALLVVLGIGARLVENQSVAAKQAAAEAPMF